MLRPLMLSRSVRLVTCGSGMSGFLNVTNGRAVTVVEVLEGREEAVALPTVEGPRLSGREHCASGGHRFTARQARSI